ncbi:Acetolactate synthase-like protein [Lamellibrachia satsuma]|nr:Acetolactate synthase-like protein [Lamellibrachia satsuma]
MATSTWSRAQVAAALSYTRDRSRVIRSWIVLRMFSKSTDRLTTFLVDNALPLCVAVTVVGVAAFVKKYNLLYRYLHKTDSKCRRNGGELVAEVLKRHNVKYMFTLVGGHISPILVACQQGGIRVIDTRHEVAAVFAADAVSRLSGTVGVAAVTAGPGLTNTITAVKNAQMAESPLLLLGGAAATLLKGRGALQDIDQMALFKPLCKYCATVAHVRDIVPTLRKALQVAQSGTPGPVFVEFPIDTLYPYHMVSKELGMKTGARGLGQKFINWYLNQHLQNLFAGAWEEQDMSPLPTSFPTVSSSQVQLCVNVLRTAKKPVILLGSQSTLPPTPADSLRRTLEDMGIPCFLSGMSRGVLGKDNPLQIRQKRRDALQEADVILLAGAVCDFRLSYGRVLNKKAKVIAVNRDKQQLYRNSDLFWKPSIAIMADVGGFLTLLAKSLQGYECDEAWLKSLRARDNEKEEANRQLAETPTAEHLNPLKLLYKLEEMLPKDSILIADGGDFVSTAAYILRPRGPLTWLDPGAFGTLGVGGGFALGAKLCRPDSEVWVVYGDGSLGYSLTEFDTYIRHKTPVLALVGNDACWTMIEREQVPNLKSNVACPLAFSDYHIVAEGFGARGYKIDRMNEDKLEDILKRAQEDCRNGFSVLVNCLIGKTSFRDGSLSV